MDISHKVAFANTLRGVAALSVLVNHYFGVFWLARDAVEGMINAPTLSLTASPTPTSFLWINTIPYFNWGAYGVALFFLISGFVIPFSLSKISWKGFLINRFFRLVPTYFVGFGVSLLAIYISSSYFSRAWPFLTQEVLLHSIPSLRDLTLSKPIDGIVWTLEVEIKFYLICALLIIWFRQKSLKVFLAPLLIFVIALVVNKKMLGMDEAHWQAGATFMLESQYVIYMFIGVLFHFLHIKRIDAYKATIGISLFCLLFCIEWSIGPFGGSFILAWSYLFALVTFTLAFNFSRPFNGNSFFNYFANISYPLYVVHGVLGYVSLRIMLENNINIALSLTLTIITSLLVAWLIHILVERPTQALGKSLGLSYFGLTKDAVDNQK
jgi:peptidoglycan/LPS O-acetylase OafA/YrhL